MNYTCPVCGYDKLRQPPVDFFICPSCGTEFGNDDFELSYEELRLRWLDNGASWFSDAVPQPENWNLFEQLLHVTTNELVDSEKTSGDSLSLTNQGDLIRPTTQMSIDNAFYVFTARLFSKATDKRVPAVF